MGFTMRNKARLRALHNLIRDARYEVLPTEKVEAAIGEHLSPGQTVTITASPRKGLSATLDLTERLSEQGYQVLPHLAGRLVSGRGERGQLVDRLTRAEIHAHLGPRGDR